MDPDPVPDPQDCGKHKCKAWNAWMQDYCGLFTESGLMPKRYLARFPVTENSIIQPGIPYI